MKKRVSRTLILTLACGVAFFCLSTPSQGHGIFKKSLEEKVEGLRVTCFACHVKREPKTKRNEFGQLFFKELDGKELSAKWESLEDDREARKKFEEETMKPLFLEALKKVGEKKNKEGEQYGDLIKEGKIEGTKLKR